MILRNLKVFCVAVAVAYFIGFFANIFNENWQFLMFVVSVFLIGGLSFAFLVFIDKDYPQLAAIALHLRFSKRSIENLLRKCFIRMIFQQGKVRAITAKI